MGQEDRKYIFSQLAQIRPPLATRLELDKGCDYLERMNKSQLARFLWAHHGFIVKSTLLEKKKYKDHHLMKIAVCGLGEYYAGFETKLMDLGMEFSDRCDGRWLVAEVAAGAIIAALTDQLYDEYRRAKAGAEKPKPGEKHIKCHFCEFTVQKFGRTGNTPSAGFAAMINHISTEHQSKMAEIEKYIGEEVTETT